MIKGRATASFFVLKIYAKKRKQCLTIYAYKRIIKIVQERRSKK